MTSCRRWFLFLLLLSASVPPARGAGEKKIAVISARNIPFSAEVIGEFRKSLRDRKVAFLLEEHPLPESESQAALMVDGIARAEPDLILSLGSSAARLVQEKASNVPQLFCMVAEDPSERMR